MKKYLLTLFSVLVSVTLMGQNLGDEFTDVNLRLTYTVIDAEHHYVEVKKQENEFNNNQVQTVNIPATVTNGSVNYTVTKIADNGFKQSNALEIVTIPNTVTSIGDNAFQGCGVLELVDMPNTVSTIGSAAFQECHKLHSISLPSSLTTISDDLFHSCHNLNEIVIPAAVVSIGERAFQNTHDVEIIFLGCGSNEKITIRSSAFTNCYNDHIEILCLNCVLKFKDQNDALINFGNNTLFHVPCGKVTAYDEVYPDNITINDANCVSVSKQDGYFCLPETWEGYESWITNNSTYPVDGSYEEKEEWLKNGDNPDRYPNFVPRNPDHPFYIKQGHRVELNHSRHIYPFNSINEGVLVVNSLKGGELIERDSIIFNGLYTLDIEYKVTKEGDQTFITRNGHDKTNITSLINSVNGYNGDYEVERQLYIRDKSTHYLIIERNTLITQLNNNTEKTITEMVDYDYYELDPYNNNNNILYYRGPGYGLQDANSPKTISDLPNFGLDESAANYNSQLQNKPDGFYLNGNHIMHVITYEGKKTVVKIDKNTANVTLHGTDYAYGHVKMHENLGGEIEIVVPIKGNAWNFVGAPFNGYNLYALKLGPAVNGQLTDATVVEFNYGEGGNDWSMSYSYANDEIGAGEGFLVWPFYDDKIVFSTVEDRRSVVPPQEGNNSESPELKIMESNFRLNNDDVVVTKTVSGDDNSGRWMALANPYPAKLCVNSFVEDNSGVIYNDNDESTQIQGQGVYVLKYNGEVQDWQFKPKTEDNDKKYDIGVGEGFFVNVVRSGENIITFKKDQLHEYNESTCVHEGHTHSAKAVEKEFIRFAMIEGERESEVLFAHNQDAQEGYDIFDANKLFAMSHIAEPYFVVDGISLVKEEVNLLPYYATMNVKSFGNKEVKFSPKYIPEGLSVTLIDGEESIDLLQGQEYATEISAGENANRFKLLIKKSLGLSDAEELEVNISNDNRIVNIATSETDLQIEVYNALGQKVFETKDRNFSLNNVSAGAYMIKAFNNKASKTQKIVVK